MLEGRTSTGDCRRSLEGRPPSLDRLSRWVGTRDEPGSSGAVEFRSAPQDAVEFCYKPADYSIEGRPWIRRPVCRSADRAQDRFTELGRAAMAALRSVRC